MANKFFKKEFDEGTQIKLEILRKYIQEWLPVFLSNKEVRWEKISLYDFFAGEGYDKIGNPGSPIIFLEELRKYCNNITDRKTVVKLILNEYDKEKFIKLSDVFSKYLSDCSDHSDCFTANISEKCIFNIIIENKDFQEIFNGIYKFIADSPKEPRFMFLDQFGIKHITEDIFQKLTNLERTDFIFFISSSFANRFIELPEFRKYLGINKQEFDINKPYHCHRVIFNYYKSLLPKNKKYYLAPFSIKKEKNIYGLIFGSNHSFGIEKFLSICWKINTQTGDANFDIDKEKISQNAPMLFSELNISKKLQVFEKELKNKIITNQIKSNIEIYEYTFEMGCLPSHANSLIKKLKNEGIIQKDLKTTSQKIHKLKLSKLELKNENNKN